MNATYQLRLLTIVRHCALLALFLGLVLSPSVVRAQIGPPLSDYLEVTITDQNGLDIVPPERFRIPEPTVTPDPGEGPLTFVIPGIDIDFVEQIGPAQLISDRFHLEPYAVIVDSRDQGPRANAKHIPGEANENFLPLRIVAFSDGEANTSNVSDFLRIRHGFWNAALGPGDLVFNGVIEEPTSETIPEPRIVFEAPAVNFDVAEPLIEDPTGQLISDFVDLQSVHGFFLSSGNPSDYANLPLANATLVENFAMGGLLTYQLRFVSHVIPEPSSIVLLGIAIVGARLIVRRRCPTA